MMHARMGKKGFVLSLSLFLLAIGMLVFSQIYAENAFERQSDASERWSDMRPLRLSIDAGRDLNLLLDQRIRLTEDSDEVFFSIRGRLPSSLSMQTNLLRYQTALREWARDQNTYAFLDLNATISDGNITGRLDNGFDWKTNLNTSRIHFYPTDVNAIPNRIDINIAVDSVYSDSNAWSLSSDGNLYINLRYTDQNTSHTTTSSGYAGVGDLNRYIWRYSSGQYGITLDVGKLNDRNGSLILDHNGYSSFGMTYSIRYTFDANTTPTRAGYVLPLTMSGKDANAIQSVQWLGS
jgi:hypothetical protein